jgi:hypothetical protein
MARKCYLIMLPAPDRLAKQSHQHVRAFYYNFLAFMRLSLKNFCHPLPTKNCNYDVVCSVKYVYKITSKFYLEEFNIAKG